MKIITSVGNLPLTPGDVLAGRFKIDRVAGGGGMGLIYRTLDLSTGESAALKLLHPGSAAAGEAERFSREAQILSELNHPGIVSYVSHGELPDGQAFLAMEWLDGEDLSSCLARGPLQIQQSILLLERIAAALAVAHRHGIIHRDIKPSNLFLVNGDLARVKLLDFGIARRTTRLHPMTRTGVVIGTPEYMAPEQARGSHELSPATDLFSLGCVLYECLTGQPPFMADHVATVLVRILFEDPRPIEEFRPDVPAELRNLLSQLLIKDPTVRLGDADQLWAAAAAIRFTPDPVSALTRTFAVARQPLFAEADQRLFSVVMAAPSTDLESSDGRPDSGLRLAESERQVLQQALLALGGTPDFLANGALLVTVSSSGSARDLAVVAARSALLIKEHWPASIVSLATGRGSVQGRSAVGEVVELAIRLSKISMQQSPDATRAGVLLDTLSAKLLEGRFAQVPHVAGGLLLSEQKDMDASRPLLGRPTPCVGRDAELAILDAQLTSCMEESEVRVVLCTAPPGMGKTRLRHEFMRRLKAGRPEIRVILGLGELQIEKAPYGTLSQLLRGLCGLSRSEPGSVQRHRLAERLAQRVTPGQREQVITFLSELAGVPLSSQEHPELRPAREDPLIMKERIRRAFLDWLAAECTEPVVLVLDDIQWCDRPSIGLLDEALRELREMPLFVLALGRPEVREVHPGLWQSHRLQEVPLKGLSRRACERLIQQVLGPQLAASEVGALVQRSAGNALFLEELIRSAAEGHSEAQPDTVVAMLQARLSRLDPELRRALLAASVFGQTFWQEGVAKLLSLPGHTPQLPIWLAALTEAELIEPASTSRLAGQKELCFRHALNRDASYALLTEADCIAGHRFAGLFLEEAGELDAAILAEHFERGAETARAAKLFCRAAEAALSKHEPETAVRLASRGIACGAQGELLGTLLALTSYCWFLLGRIDLSLPLALEAKPLVLPGSLAWTYSMSGACLAAPSGPPESQRRFPELMAEFLAVEPQEEAEALYADTASHLVVAMACVAPLGNVEELGELSRLRALCDRAEVRSPTLRRHFHSAHGRCLSLAAPAPWQVAQDGEAVVRLSLRSGDVRCLHFASIMEVAWCELGDADVAIQKLQAYPPSKEGLFAPTSRVRLAFVLSTKDASASQQQALLYSQEVLDKLGPFPLTAIPAHDCQARVLLRQGRLAEAAWHAQEACRIQATLPRFWLNAKATLIRVLLAQGNTTGALAAAEEGLAAIRHFGCIGDAEVELRLVISEAIHGAGDITRGTKELQETLLQIRLRAQSIPDEFWRTSYLTRNPTCARAQHLAQKWAAVI